MAGETQNPIEPTEPKDGAGSPNMGCIGILVAAGALVVCASLADMGAGVIADQGPAKVIEFVDNSGYTDPTIVRKDHLWVIRDGCGITDMFDYDINARGSDGGIVKLRICGDFGGNFTLDRR